MKLIRNSFGGLAIIGGIIALSGFIQAQVTTVPVQSGAISLTDTNVDWNSLSDAEVELRAIEAMPPIPYAQLPDSDMFGTFYSAQHSPISPEPWPPLPGNVRKLDVWSLGTNDSGSGIFLIDDLAVNYTVLLAKSSATRSGAQTMDVPFPGDGDSDTNSDGDGTNGGGFSSFQAQVFTTNDLWLQIITVTNGTATLAIHLPWNITNDVYDLLYCTNLSPPISWQWLLRTDPGQTNLVVSNAVDAQGFYRLGSPNDLIENDSLGTNFWVAFFNLYDGFDNNLSLYVSSPVAAAGTVTCSVNGPVLTITGDPLVNGTYVLTNTPPSEMQNYSVAASMYVNGDLQVVRSTEFSWKWTIWNYHLPGSPEYFYYSDGFTLNGTNWINFYGDEVISVSCPQILLSQPFSLAAGAVTNVPIPAEVMLTDFNAVENQGIHVTASQPVSVYGFDYLNTLSAAFTAYPTPLLGTNYCVMARPTEIDDYFVYSQLAIVGTAVNTTVTITPSATADGAGLSTASTNIVLQPGEAYQLGTEGPLSDVTGTMVTSDKPIAVFAGANVADVPDVNTGAQNPLVQEQPPVEQWGTNVLAISFAGRTNGDTYRVLAAYDDTLVTITGKVVTVVNNLVFPHTVTTTNETVTTNLAAGAFCDIILDGPVQFQATKPIQVAQFANGYQFDNLPNREGDPCEILLPPTGHWMNSYTVYTPTNNGVTGDFDENYLNLIVAQSAITNTLVDGFHIATTNFVAIGSSGYYGAQLTVTNSGSHTAISSQPVEVQVYGWGNSDAYGYFGGAVK